MSARVKPLVWEDDSDHWHPETRWRAKDCFGEHYEIELSDGVYTLSHKALMGDIEADALAEAKAAAQADYETRIRAALEPQDAPAMAEELVALRAALEDLRKSAALLQQNAEGCAVNHYGADFAVHGMPGWLADTAASIARATAALTPEAKS